MSARILTALVILAAVPIAASAAITDITLHGVGSVTAYQGDPLWGVPYIPPGTPVTVSVGIHLGTASGDPANGFAPAPPNGFTGTYLLTDDALKADGYGMSYASYGWSITPGDAANSSDSAASFYGDNTLTFVHGVLTGFNLDYVGDPDAHGLDPRAWSFDYAYPIDDEPPPYGGGSWTITYNSTGSLTGTIPEPSGWALMIAGFGLAGCAMRRGRGQRATA